MRRLAWFAGGFSGGVFLARYGLPGDRGLFCAFAALGLAFLALALPWERRRRAVAFLAALAMGLGYDWLYVRQVQQAAEACLGEGDGIRTVTLLDLPEESDFGARVTVRLEGVPGKAVYYGGRELLELEPGQTLTGPVRLQSAARVRDEDISAFTSRGVFLLVYGGDAPQAGPGTSGGWRWLPLRAGRALRAELSLLFEGDAAGFLAGILTGDRSGLSEAASAALGEAGLSHILAVSGMHCAMLLAPVSLLIGRHRRRALFACAVPLLVFYVLMAGCGPSAVRACVMLALLLAGPLFRRESDGPTALLAALLLILLANPFAAASVSLQLSFAAMTGILWLTPRLSAAMPETWAGRAPLRGVWGSLSVTCGALVFAAPLSAWYFGFLSLLTPLSSLLCLPAASGTFCFGLLAALAGLVCPPLGRLLAWPAALLTRYILSVAGLLSKVPHQGVYFANPYMKYWLIYVYLLFAAVLLMRRRGARRRAYTLAAALAVLTLALTARLGAERYGGDLEVLVLDVGQGQSVILASGGDYALVDCGSANSWKDAGETAAHRLRAMGCGKLDYLCLTHWDSDHVSGVPGLLARLEAEALLAPEGEAGQEAVLGTAEAGALRRVTEREVLPFGKGTLTVFPPLGEGESNERGLTVLVSVGDRDFLITGDMDAATERRLLERWELPEVEGMMAGHHGSRSATSQALLDAVSPETVCISVGSNTYGHPAEEVLTRLARQGCTVCRTDRMGTVRLSWNLEE